jgi:hypothetical protein
MFAILVPNLAYTAAVAGSHRGPARAYLPPK